jgi:hypothetical protein
VFGSAARGLIAKHAKQHAFQLYTTGAPVKTGKEQLVQVQYIQGLANQDDPKSCVWKSNPPGEALIGERTGQEIEPRNV